MSIKFNICNDIAQAALDRLNNSKVNINTVEYIAECFNIILTLYNQEINVDNLDKKVIKLKGRKKKDDQPEIIPPISNKE